MAEACVNTSKLPIQCPVCLETYDRPRTLPCLHSFCSICLQGHITNAAQNSHFSSFLCPVCRSNTRPPRPYSGKDTWAEQFPINHWIVSIIDEAYTSKQDDTLYCDLHPDSKVNLYCFDHEAVCCAMCIATTHRKCERVDEIETILDQSDSEQARNDILTRIKHAEDVLTDLAAKCALADSNLQIDKDKMVSVVEKEHTAAMMHLDALKQAAIDSVEQDCRLISNEILTRKLMCTKGKQTCKQIKDMLTVTREFKSPSVKFIQVNAARLKMKAVDVSFANNWSFNEANTLQFETDHQFTEIKNIQLLGKVKDARDDDTSPAEGIPLFQANTCSQSDRQDSSEVRVLQNNNSTNQNENVGSRDAIDVTPTAIRRCTELQYVMYWNNLMFRKHWITGLTFLQHGLLIVCTQTHSSLCILKERTILHEEKKGSPPWDISKLSDTSVVVTYPQESLVRIFEIKCKTAVWRFYRIVGRPKSSHREFSTQDACFGVVVAVGRIFIACEDCIKVYTVNGLCVQILKLSHRVEPLFERVISLSYDVQRSTLYAADEVSHAVFSFRLTDGQLNNNYSFMYKNPNLHCPRGLAVDMHGEIFVTGFVSKSIHVLNSYGECVKILSTEQSPCSVFVDQKQSLLIVSFYPEVDRRSEQSNDVRFYKIRTRFNTHSVYH